MSETSSVDVTVVVCTFNRAAMLRACLASLTRLETDNLFSYEILVVDNNSTDDTARAVQQISAASVPVRYVAESQQGYAYARNRGIEDARGEWIASFDDDQIADPRWLVELWLLARDKHVRSVGGAVELKLPPDLARPLSPVCRRLLGESARWTAPRPYSRKEGPGSGNQLLHRSIFDQVGRFDPAYNQRGEDTDLYRRMRRAGIESWFTPSAIAWHVIPAERLEEHYLRRTSRHNGRCFAYRDCQEWGRLALAAVLMARVGQAVCVHLPRFAWAMMSRAREDALAARCLLWRFEGYIASALRLLATGEARA